MHGLAPSGRNSSRVTTVFQRVSGARFWCRWSKHSSRGIPLGFSAAASAKAFAVCTSKARLAVAGARSGLRAGEQFRSVPALDHPVARLGQRRRVEQT